MNRRSFLKRTGAFLALAGSVVGIVKPKRVRYWLCDYYREIGLRVRLWEIPARNIHKLHNPFLGEWEYIWKNHPDSKRFTPLITNPEEVVAKSGRKVVAFLEIEQVTG